MVMKQTRTHKHTHSAKSEMYLYIGRQIDRLTGPCESASWFWSGKRCGCGAYLLFTTNSKRGARTNTTNKSFFLSFYLYLANSNQIHWLIACRLLLFISWKFLQKTANRVEHFRSFSLLSFCSVTIVNATRRCLDFCWWFVDADDSRAKTENHFL